jgi:hypothetical protein
MIDAGRSLEAMCACRRVLPGHRGIAVLLVFSLSLPPQLAPCIAAVDARAKHDRNVVAESLPGWAALASGLGTLFAGRALNANPAISLVVAYFVATLGYERTARWVNRRFGTTISEDEIGDGVTSMLVSGAVMAGAALLGAPVSRQRGTPHVILNRHGASAHSEPGGPDTTAGAR